MNAWREVTRAGLRASSLAVDTLQQISQNFVSAKEQTRRKYTTAQPWPQPSPIHFKELAATVLNVPPDEIREFLDQVVSRYVKTLRTYWWDAAKYTLRHPCLEDLTDEDFVRLICESPLCRLVHKSLDPGDRKVFGREIARSHSTLYKVDLSLLEGIECLPGLYAAPTLTLLERQGRGRSLAARAIYLNGTVFTPRDPAWKLARYFVLQGGALSLVAGIHPTVHFPMDAINALSKTILPDNHLIRRLLEPHLYMQLPLNYAVLYIDRSVAHNNQREIYTPFPFDKENFFKVMRKAFAGIEGNSAYPEYRYSVGAPNLPFEYGRAIRKYYGAIHRFVSEVLGDVSSRDVSVLRWANEISRLVPGFPDGQQIFKQDTLSSVVASFICNVSIIHSADHYGYSSLNVNQVPLRLRVKPPTSKRAVPEKNWVRWEDIFRHRMAREMYFRPSTLTRLCDTTYDLQKKRYRDAFSRFIDELHEIDAELASTSFVPLAEIAASIQY